MSNLVQLVRPPDEPIDHEDDVETMQLMLINLGFWARPSDIQWAWRQYSDDTSAAGWLDPQGLPDDVVAGAILDRLVREEER